ncbi:MAG: hypothetical protein ACRELY_26460 [Polyangiaceae bacterium]
MNRDEAFDAWAPKGAPWSRWVKPILFTFADAASGGESSADDQHWIEEVVALESEEVGYPHRSSARVRDIAVIVDLAGPSSVRAGLAMTREGFFPIPLFNALPHPSGVVDMMVVVNALVAGVAPRARAVLAETAPPSFLLDSRRHGGRVAVSPGVFDNRAVTFETDFPSPSRLQSAGVHRVVVVHEDRIAPDLVEMLATWQQNGIAIFAKRIAEPGLPTLVAMRRLSFWRRVEQWFSRRSLRRGTDGAFGGMIPHPSGG